MQDRLRPLWGPVWDEPRAPGAPARVRRDWVLVGVLLPLVVVEGALRPEIPPLWTAVTAALVPTLLWRRTRPLLMLAILFGTVTVLPLLAGGHSPEVRSSAFALIVVYALFRWGSGREMVLGSALVLAKLVEGALLDDLGDANAVGGLAVLTAIAGVGVAVRYRASARRRLLDQVAVLERERLARDLHDTVAHHVSAMAIRAQAGLATAELDPAAATEALRVIEAEATRTLAEMRAMVRVLRGTAPADLAPGPSLLDVAGLATPGRTGPAVDVEVTGDLAGVPPAVGAAIYRLAQESVTNARRHARHATRIEVRVAADDAEVRLRVTDDGDAAHGAAPGYGLLGMAERAQLLGGTCEAGPGPGRGWTVRAALPRASTP